MTSEPSLHAKAEPRAPEWPVGIHVGDLVNEKYRIERILGAGGMGVVLAAHHLQLDERVALKLLLPEALVNAQAVQRFIREARAAAKLKSEHAARVIDVGVLDDGAPFMVMEYLEGEDLDAWLKARGALEIELAVDFVLQASVAIAEAHSLGIIHRDLKPANLFCTRRYDGQLSIKVLDFGISKVAEPGQAANITKTTAVMGSPAYMSPEQMRSSKVVDPRSDVWSLGVVLYELLTGAVPFASASIMELGVKIAMEAPASLRSQRAEIPRELEAVVLKCLAKGPDERFQDVGALATALQPFAPRRSSASIDRILGILASGPRPARAVSISDSSSSAVSATSATQPSVVFPVAATRRSAILWGMLAVGVLMGAAYAGLSRRGPSMASPSSSAGLVSAEAASSPSLPTPAPPLTGASADQEDVPSSPMPTSASHRQPTTGPLPSTTGRPVSSAKAPGRPKACTETVVTEYDSEGNPHFKKLCQ